MQGFVRFDLKGFIMQVEVVIKNEKAEFFLRMLKEMENVVESFTIKDNEEKEILEILNKMSEEEKKVSHTKIVEIDI
jgi:K+/H+ antiporter YhaU regulatory subunit KhtT